MHHLYLLSEFLAIRDRVYSLKGITISGYQVIKFVGEFNDLKNKPVILKD